MKKSLKNEILPLLLETATIAVTSKIVYEKKRFRHNVARRVYDNHEEELQAAIIKAVSPLFNEQVQSMKEQMLAMDGEKSKVSDQAKALASQVFDPHDPKWTASLINKALPVMVEPMLKAMKAAMVEAGVNPTKGLKANPHHDSAGRFAPKPSSGGGSSGNETRSDVKKALGRSKEDIDEIEKDLIGKRAGLSKSTEKILIGYTNNDHVYINSRLRQRVSIDEVATEKDVVGLQKACKQSIEEVVIFRGMNPDQGGWKRGSTVELGGFLSATLDVDVALRFAKSQAKGTSYTPSLMIIKARTGIAVADKSMSSGEREVIQAHNTKYKYLGWKQGVVNGTTVGIVQMEEIVEGVKFVKANPFHDSAGRFAPKPGIGGFMLRIDRIRIDPNAAITRNDKDIELLGKDLLKKRNSLSYYADDAIRGYTSTEYTSMNESLRQGRSTGNTIFDNRIDILQKATQQPIEDIIVYRGISSRRDLGWSVGDQVQVNGFVSTSLDAKVATQFAEDKAPFEKTPRILEIRAKTGIFVKDKYAALTEEELIQGHGRIYDYVGTRSTEINGTTVKVLTLEEVATPVTKANPFHDSAGRFTSRGGGGGGGPSLAPNPGGGSGASGRASTASATYDEESKKWKLGNGNPVPSHIPRIPPAWKEVKVATDSKADLLVTGRDKKGRRQSVYSEAHWAKAAEKKFARTNELRTKEKDIRKELDNDVKNPATKEQAATLRLIQATGVRPGSRTDTGAEKQAYGATTLEGRHVRVSKTGNVNLMFTGKKGVQLNIPVSDPIVAADLKSRKKKAGAKGQVFETSSSSLLVYSKTKDGGGFKSKDFRTAKGTSTAVSLVKSMPIPKTEKGRKKAIKAVATKVSKVLGNTPTIALQSYIDPNVFAAWNQAS